MKDFATVAKPLSAAAEKDRRFSWDERCQESFDELKTLLTTSPILAYRETDGRLVLDTDASNYCRKSGGDRRGCWPMPAGHCLARKEIIASRDGSCWP